MVTLQGEVIWVAAFSILIFLGLFHGSLVSIKILWIYSIYYLCDVI